MDLLVFTSIGLLLGYTASRVYRESGWEMSWDLVIGALAFCVGARSFQALRLGWPMPLSFSCAMLVGLLVGLIALFWLNVLRRV